MLCAGRAGARMVGQGANWRVTAPDGSMVKSGHRRDPDDGFTPISTARSLRSDRVKYDVRELACH